MTRSQRHQDELPAEGYAHEAEVEPWQRRTAAYAYFGIVAALALLVAAAQANLPSHP